MNRLRPVSGNTPTSDIQNVKGPSRSSAPHGSPCYLLTATDPVELCMIESRLRDSQIPVFRKFPEASGYLDVFTGSPFYGADLYVPSDLMGTAKEVIHSAQFLSQSSYLPDFSRTDNHRED